MYVSLGVISYNCMRIYNHLKMKALAWPKYRSLTTPDVDKDTEQQASSFIAGGHAKQHGHLGGSKQN